MAFGEVPQAALSRLKEGDAVAIQGGMKVLYTARHRRRPSGGLGHTRLSGANMPAGGAFAGLG
jgi:hypothetical protein